MNLKALKKPKLLELAKELRLDVSDALRKLELIGAILAVGADDDELSECIELINERATAKRLAAEAERQASEAERRGVEREYEIRLEREKREQELLLERERVQQELEREKLQQELERERFLREEKRREQDMEEEEKKRQHEREIKRLELEISRTQFQGDSSVPSLGAERLTQRMTDLLRPYNVGEDIGLFFGQLRAYRREGLVCPLDVAATLAYTSAG